MSALDYPRDLLQIQVLDDSTDDTSELSQKTADELKTQGFNISVIHRTDRTGYKAGALEAGLKDAEGEYILILDADFLPEHDMLKKTVHYFTYTKVGMIQTRWGPYQSHLFPPHPRSRGDVPRRPFAARADGAQPERTILQF